MATNHKDDDAINPYVLIIGAVSIVALWFLFGWLFYWNLCDTQASAYGDSFGAVNALFAGLAFGGVIWAILLQRQELQLQRREIRETKETHVLSARLNALHALWEHYIVESYSPSAMAKVMEVLDQLEEVLAKLDDPQRPQASYKKKAFLRVLRKAIDHARSRWTGTKDRRPQNGLVAMKSFAEGLMKIAAEIPEDAVLQQRLHELAAKCESLNYLVAGTMESGQRAVKDFWSDGDAVFDLAENLCYDCEKEAFPYFKTQAGPPTR